MHVPSGAFGTTWGKRRYGRFGEHIIGILLVFTFLFVVFQQFIGRAMVNPELVKEATNVKMGTTARMDKIALVMIGFALVVAASAGICASLNLQKYVHMKNTDPVTGQPMVNFMQLRLWWVGSLLNGACELLF